MRCWPLRYRFKAIAWALIPLVANNVSLVAFNLSPAACLEALNVSPVRSVIPSPGQSYSEPLQVPLSRNFYEVVRERRHKALTPPDVFFIFSGAPIIDPGHTSSVPEPFGASPIA